MKQAVMIPSNPEAVTPSWMTQVLGEAGNIQYARITGLRHEMVANQGIAGQVIRFHLTYDQREEHQVASIIAKFPSSNAELRKGIQHLYRNEVFFYKNLPTDLGLIVPKPYFCGYDEDSGDNLLLLEDLSKDTHPGNIVSGCTLEEAQAAVAQLAKFHAAWWGEKHQSQFGWLPHKSDDLKNETSDQFFEQFENWVHKVEEEVPGFHFPPSFLQAGALLARNYLRIKLFLYNAPATVVHDDFKLDNMIFRGSRVNRELVIIDWHLVNRAPGVCDLGYFNSFCLSAEQRKVAEQDLIKGYYTALCEHGVQNYAFSRFLLEYRLSALEPLERIVQVSFALDRTNPAITAYFRALLERMCPFIEDCRVEELLN